MASQIFFEIITNAYYYSNLNSKKILIIKNFNNKIRSNNNI